MSRTTDRHRLDEVSDGGSRWRSIAQLLTVGLLSGLVALATAAPTAQAQTTSPAIGPSRITVNDPIGQGEVIDLPPISVANPGDEPQTFAVDISFIGEQQELLSDPSWFRLEPQQFVVDPGKGQTVEVRMTVPRDAEPGDYLVLIRARGVQPPQGGGGGVRISAAVATTLRFSIKNVNCHFYDPVVGFYTERSPSSWVGSALLLTVAVGYLLQRRYDFNINVGMDVQRRDD